MRSLVVFWITWLEQRTVDRAVLPEDTSGRPPMRTDLPQKSWNKEQGMTLRLCVTIACASAFSSVTNLLHAHSLHKRREIVRFQQLLFNNFSTPLVNFTGHQNR